MDTRLQLKLKQPEVTGPESERIYEFTRNTVEGFNNYVSDFFETIAILKETLLHPGTDEQKKRETVETIRYVEEKIGDLTVKMKAIADEMSSLIEVALHHEGR